MAHIHQSCPTGTAIYPAEGAERSRRREGVSLELTFPGSALRQAGRRGCLLAEGQHTPQVALRRALSMHR